MYEQHLPPSPDSPDVAAAWARGIALHERAELADKAEETARGLVAQAIRRTPAEKQIHARIEVTARGLLIEVRDPGRPDPDGTGIELSEVSSIATSFGSRGGPDGHLSWTELRTLTAV